MSAPESLRNDSGALLKPMLGYKRRAMAGKKGRAVTFFNAPTARGMMGMFAMYPESSVSQGFTLGYDNIALSGRAEDLTALGKKGGEFREQI